MRVRALTSVVVVLCCFAWSFASETAYLPQVANGTSPGVLSVRTTFIVFNPTTVADNVTIHLTGDNGGAMPVTIPGLGTDDEFQFGIGPGETKIFQTSGAGSIQAGAARVESQHPLGVSAIFTMYNGTGGFLTEAGVGSSPLMSRFVIPVDATGGFNTGVALFAPQASALTYTLRHLNGTVAGTTTGSLGTRSHMAKFVAGSGGLFPNVSNFTRGTLEVSCTTQVAAVVLRQHTTLANTTLPVVSKTSPQTSFNLPQIANGGDLAGTNIRTTFIVFNISGSQANVTINVRKPEGAAFPVTVSGNESPLWGTVQPEGASPAQSGTLNVTLQPGASAFLQTSGAGTLSAGSAQVSSNVPIGVSAIFTLYNGQTFLTEAGVGDSPENTDFTLPVDISATSSTGVALFNTGNIPALVDIWLVDEAGWFAGRIPAPISLPAHNQSAQYISALFPGKTSFKGTMCISADGGDVAAVALRQNNPPLSFTTLPVVQGSFDGTLPQASALLDSQKTGIGATSNTTVNAQLPGGFKISGTFGGALGTAYVVTARSTATGGRTYAGWVDNQTKRYVVVVPAGTYELALCYLPDSMIPLGLPSLTYTVSPTLTVNGDTTKNISVPAVTLHTIMGTVTGIDQVGAEGGQLILSTADGKYGVTAFVMPGLPYTAQVPAGTYSASLALSIGQKILGFYNLGTVTVNGMTTANFTVPASVQLSGTVSHNGVPGAPANTYITVTDAGLPNALQQLSSTSCIASTAVSLTQVGAGGAYQLHVPKDRALVAGLNWPVGTPAFGSAGFPWPGRNLGSLSGNRTENFNIPVLPAPVQISGKVTNSQGQGVAGVSVGAFSDQLTGAASVYFASSADTDLNGNYTIQVLSGTNYTLTFVPPMPTP